MEFNATFFAQLWMKHGQVMGSTVHILVTEEKLKFICDGKFDSPVTESSNAMYFCRGKNYRRIRHGLGIMHMDTTGIPEIMVA